MAQSASVRRYEASLVCLVTPQPARNPKTLTFNQRRRGADFRQVREGSVTQRDSERDAPSEARAAMGAPGRCSTGKQQLRKCHIVLPVGGRPCDFFEDAADTTRSIVAAISPAWREMSVGAYARCSSGRLPRTTSLVRFAPAPSLLARQHAGHRASPPRSTISASRHWRPTSRSSPRLTGRFYSPPRALAAKCIDGTAWASLVGASAPCAGVGTGNRIARRHRGCCRGPCAQIGSA